MQLGLQQLTEVLKTDMEVLGKVSKGYRDEKPPTAVKAEPKFYAT